MVLVDLRGDSNKQNMDSQTGVFSLLISFLVLSALFTIIFSSTVFLLQTSTGSGVFAQKDTQNTAISNPSAFDDKPDDDKNALPVKVVLYKDPFAGIELEAQSVCVLDTVTGEILYERNKNLRMPLASLTKIMTAQVATELAEGDDLVVIQEEDIAKEGDSGLLLGEKWKLADIINFTLLTSSNDGASAIASAAGAFSPISSTTTPPFGPKKIFIKKMNEQARTLGLTQMEFYNESGLDNNGTQSGAYGTAQELATLFEHILKNKPNLLKATTHSTLELNSQSDITHTVKNTNEFVEEFPGLMASKTGFTDLAGGNLGVAFDSGIGSPIIIIVLGSTFDGRFEDVMKLYWASLEEVGQDVY